MDYNIEKRLTDAYNLFTKGKGVSTPPYIYVGPGIWTYYTKKAYEADPDKKYSGIRFASAKMVVDASLGPNDFIITNGST